MNALLDNFPSVAVIDGKEYALNTDFRVCLKIMIALEDNELTPIEKQIVVLELLYAERPQNVKRAIELAMLFLNYGEEITEENASNSERVYSFEKDSKYIVTAFQQTYSIDLDKVDYMHWWKFSYLFLDLKEDCFFTRLIDLRNRKNKGKLTKEEKEYCYKIKDIIDLPRIETVEEIRAKNRFMELLGN